MNFFEYRCELVAKVPRLGVERRGPSGAGAWAREGSGFTLMMEALVMLLSAEMPVDAMADLLDEHDTRLWRVLCTTWRKHTQRATGVPSGGLQSMRPVPARTPRRDQCAGRENSRLLLMVEGRGVTGPGAFAEALR